MTRNYHVSSVLHVSGDLKHFLRKKKINKKISPDFGKIRRRMTGNKLIFFIRLMTSEIIKGGPVNFISGIR